MTPWTPEMEEAWEESLVIAKRNLSLPNINDPRFRAANEVFLAASAELKRLGEIVKKAEDVETLAEVIAKERFKEEYVDGDGNLVIDEATALSNYILGREK